MRYVIPQFNGQENIPNLSLKLKGIVAVFGAVNIRVNKAFGVVTFGLVEAEFGTPDFEYRSKLWHALLDRLAELHPNCIAWSYSRLDTFSTDRRTNPMDTQRYASQRRFEK